MFYVCSFDLYHLSKTKSPCNLKKKKLFIDNVSFVHNHMFGIRQTPKTRGHIMDSSTGSLTFNLELWLFTNLSYQRSTYTTDTTFCDAWLEVNVSSLQFINEHSNAAFVKKKYFCMSFFWCTQICVLIWSYFRYNHYQFYLLIFSILFYFILFIRKTKMIPYLYSIYFVQNGSFINLFFIQFCIFQFKSYRPSLTANMNFLVYMNICLLTICNINIICISTTFYFDARSRVDNVHHTSGYTHPGILFILGREQKQMLSEWVDKWQQLFEYYRCK